MIKNIVDIQNNKIIIKDGFFGIDSTNPRAKLQIGDGNSLSTNPILLQVADTLAVIKDGNRKRVGIGKYPEEDLDVDGNIQISASGQEKITFYDTGHGHEHGKLLYTDDGNGSKFEIFTKNASSGNVEQTFTINNQGAVGIGTNPNFGTPGQIIKSNGTNSIYWDSPNQDVIWTPYVEPFGLANIGGLVTMDNQTAYYSSFYTSSALRYDKILLYTTESTVNFTGHIGVAIFDSNNSAVGTNKLQEGILQYTNSLSSGQELSINFSNPVVLNSNSKYWVAIAIDSNSGSLGIAKSSSVNTDNIHIRKESSTNFTTSGFSSVVSTTNSNLNFWYRLYNSQVSTFNDFTDLSTELSLFEVNGTNVVSRFTINNQGAFGIGTNPNFGTPGQVLTSQGTNSVTWEENRLENLADVNISNATINDLIKWDGTNFINFAPGVRIITSVKKTVSQSFTSGSTSIKITGWDAPHVDIGTTGWSNANSRYTIQRTATYRIDFKAIITNTSNDTSALRYLNMGIYIYNSGGGTPVFYDLDTTTLVNVDSGFGFAERGSGDYTIIRTLTATQYLEFELTALQATGNYSVESAVFNIEELV